MSESGKTEADYLREELDRERNISWELLRSLVEERSKTYHLTRKVEKLRLIERAHQEITDQTATLRQLLVEVSWAETDEEIFEILDRYKEKMELKDE